MSKTTPITTVKPMFDRILVRRDDAPDVTKGGIHIPDAARETVHRGFVVALGPGRRAENGTFMAIPLELGSIITFGKYSGAEIQVDGETLLVMREDDVLTVHSA